MCATCEGCCGLRSTTILRGTSTRLSMAERVDGGIRVLIGVADVSRSVEKGTPLDHHAADQTQTVYTAVRNFPMLPNELSTDLTSLNQDVDRAAMVMEYVVDAQG